MKKTAVLTLFLVASMSCNIEQGIQVAESGLVPLTVNADRGQESKMYVTEEKKVYWEDDDRIAVFDGVAKREFTIVSHSGGNAVFQGFVSEDASNITAVYPYGAAESLNADGTVTLSVPREQKASSHGVDPGALIAIAQCPVAEAHLAFKNVTSLAKFEITEDGISAISIKAASPVQIAGKVKAATTGFVDSLSIESTRDYQVTLRPSGQSFAKGWYLIPVLPSSCDGGYVFDIEGEKGVAAKTVSDKKEFRRSGIVNFSDIFTGAAWKADPFLKGSTVRILCLGNSFSEDACEEHLYDIFKSEGIEAVIGNGYVSSCDLSMHWNYANNNIAAYSYRKIVGGSRTATSGKTTLEMLKDESWDYIVFQQGGGNQGFYATYELYLTNLISYCRTNALKKDFKTVFHYNWAAAKDCTSEKFGKYGYDQMKMYNAQAAACAQADSVHHFDVIANTGDAIQSGRNSYLGDTWNRDGWHLKKTYGRYCASCVFYEAITGKSSIGVKYHPSTMTACVATLCQNCAHCAALYKYKYADMGWYRNTDTDPEAKGRILAKWLFDKTVSVSAGHQASWTGSSVPLGTQAISNAPGLVGYMDANAEGSGRISFYQIDKTSMKEENAARYILNGNPGGQPAVCGQMGGDYWIIETTGGDTFSEGDHLYASFTVHPGKYGAKYWLLEYQDGEEWLPAYPKKSKDLGIASGIDVSKFEYNLEMSTNAKLDCVVDVRLTAQTPAFRIRLTCCSTYQVNDKYWSHPRNASEFRIAGTAADGNLPYLKLMFE